jgi:NAD+ synthase
MAQGQDEFYFALPYEKMDLALWAHNHSVTAAELAPHIGLSADEAQVVYEDIESKRRTTAYLHAAPILVESVSEISR